MYRLGDRVRVQVVRVDMERRQIDLGLVESSTRCATDERRGPREQGRAEAEQRATRPGKRERATRKAFEKGKRRRWRSVETAHIHDVSAPQRE